MELAVIAAIIQAGLFQVYYLIVKGLQEKGLSNLGIFYYQRLAVIPGGLLAAVTFKREYITFLFSHPLLLAALLFCSGVWVVHTFFRVYVIDAANSMSFFNAFSALISLPLLLFAGIVVNHDLPNSLMLIGLLLLVAGLVLRPSVHKMNAQKTTLSIGVFIAALCVLLGQSIDAINSAAYRYLLEHFSALLFALSTFIFLSTFVIVMVFWVLRVTGHPYRDNVRHPMGYWLPALFVVATLFEGYSLARISIYALVAIGSFTFIVSTIGDLYSHRLKFSFRTAVFLFLVMAGTTFAAVAVG